MDKNTLTMAQSQRKKDQFITKQDKKLLLNDNQSLEDQTDIKKIQPKTEDPYAEITEQPAFENVRFHSDSDGQVRDEDYEDSIWF